MKVCLTCSPGGHLTQLEQLRPWWEGHERFWVVVDRDDTRSVLPGEHIIAPYFPTTRSARNAVRNFFLAIRALHRERPDVVVSTGAAIAVPFFLAAKLLGIATVYIEVFGRINLPTLSGRLCHPLADLFVLQWPDQQRFYPKGKLVGPLLPAMTIRGESLDAG
jgi:UDP-N-acetylglucosamine:LPS N-acetylglucosamine transferase